MDILRRELNEVYERQCLAGERLDPRTVAEAVGRAKAAAQSTGLCCVVTDIAADCCYFIPGKVALMLGLGEKEMATERIDSADEDFLYARVLPVHLAELRMLEYEFFKIADSAAPSRKKDFKAFGSIAMQGASGLVSVRKTTQVLELSPRGKIWLVLCCYDFGQNFGNTPGISPEVADLTTGEHTLFFDFADRRADVLTGRQKQILRLIAAGRLSKEIAAELGLSLNTVNRHRQNILEKLSVDNSMEAVAAARAMGLMP